MKMTSIAIALLALGAAAQVSAVTAGRVLAVAGTATIERGGQQLPLQSGTAVETGDVLAVGDKSTLQVRFTDESVVALRANSQFKIENYRFDKNAESDRSLLGLLKGGMRTITGLIGKANQKNYAVQTATATIGIRGTHFAVVSCNNDCSKPDGSPQDNGTYGGVTDGRITVSNQAGSREFGQQDYFHVPDSNTAPIRLMAPPVVLSERGSDSRSRKAVSADAKDDGAGVGSRRGLNSRMSTSPQLTELASPAIGLIAPLIRVAATDQPAVTSGSSSSNISLIELQGHATTTTDFTTFSSRELTPAQLRGMVTEVSLSPFNNAQSFVAVFPPPRVFGSSAAAGAYWTYDTPDVGSINSLGGHHIFGDTPNISFPNSGFAQYNYVGGTAPTDNYGRTGKFSGSNLLMDFGSQQIKTASAMTMGFGTNVLQSTATVYSIPANTVWAMGTSPSTLSGVTCTTGCFGSTSGMIAGRFVGASAQGYAAAIKVFNTQLDTYKANAAGNVVAFARQ